MYSFNVKVLTAITMIFMMTLLDLHLALAKSITIGSETLLSKICTPSDIEKGAVNHNVNIDFLYQSESVLISMVLMKIYHEFEIILEKRLQNGSDFQSISTISFNCNNSKTCESISQDSFKANISFKLPLSTFSESMIRACLLFQKYQNCSAELCITNILQSDTKSLFWVPVLVIHGILLFFGALVLICFLIRKKRKDNREPISTLEGQVHSPLLEFSS